MKFCGETIVWEVLPILARDVIDGILDDQVEIEENKDQLRILKKNC